MISSNYSICFSIYLRTNTYYTYVHFPYVWELSLIKNSNVQRNFSCDVTLKSILDLRYNSVVFESVSSGELSDLNTFVIDIQQASSDYMSPL